MEMLVNEPVKGVVINDFKVDKVYLRIFQQVVQDGRMPHINSLRKSNISLIDRPHHIRGSRRIVHLFSSEENNRPAFFPVAKNPGSDHKTLPT